jgi:hypothetical protein
LLFVASASDIRSWAGVPRKAFDYQHGFQRTLTPGRVTDIIQYFREDPQNISPTSIVVGFTGAVAIDSIPATAAGSSIESVRIRISLPDLTEMSLEDLTDLALQELRARLPAVTVEEIEANAETAIAEAMKLQDEDAVDEAFGIESETAIDLDATPRGTGVRHLSRVHRGVGKPSSAAWI